MDIPQNIKLIIKSVAPLTIVLILFVLVGNFGISNIKQVNTEINSAKRDNNVLSQKASLLSSISNTLGNSPNVATTAIPVNNSSLMALSQVRNLASQNQLSVTNIKSGPSAGAGGISKIVITFEADGTIDQIGSFLQSLSTIAPITSLDGVKIAQGSRGVTANISISTFWAPAPTSLPAVSQSVNDLTSDEKTVLARVATLTQPIFSEVTPVVSTGRSDPFTP